MKKSSLFLSVIVFLGSYLLAGPTVVDTTLATVNGEAILLSDFNRETAPILEQYQQLTPAEEQNPQDLQKFKQKLLEQMVDERLLRQEAKKQKITPTPRDIDAGIAEVRRRFKSDEEFQQELKKTGLSEEKFRERIKEQLMVMQLIEREVKSKITPPTEKEVQDLYDTLQKINAGEKPNTGNTDQDKQLLGLAQALKRMSEETIRARHILIRVEKNATLKDKSAALKKIKEIQDKIKNGADFAEMAKVYSQDPGSSSRGGDLGYFTHGDMVPEFEKVAFSLETGKVSEPVLTDFGYHLIRVEEKRAARKVSLSDVKNELQEIVYRQKMAQAYENWLKDLRAKAVIKINPIP